MKLPEVPKVFWIVTLFTVFPETETVGPLPVFIVTCCVAVSLPQLFVAISVMVNVPFEE